jgi:uncharacterized protein YraI
MKHFAFALLLVLGTHLRAQAHEPPQTYVVIAIGENDTLSVRSRPSESSSIVAKLRNGTTGIQIVGPSIRNGTDDWVPIIVSGIRGWVRPKYLSASVASTRGATSVKRASEDLPAVDLSIPADWRPHSREWTRVYGAAANGYIDEARRRLGRGESGTLDDIRYGWADYLYQQQRIRFWTPIVIAAGIAAVDAMLKADPGPSLDEIQSRYEHDKGVIEYERQKQQRTENDRAESRNEPRPYPNAPRY